ncbi:lymphocyte antigen 75 [Elysia marginata]|uniref:Lymphocyte antigen 75 n=1 Tax=Elysia marginata TaxID=1093978 RepID=A0AAV4EEQ3_9GAST|nr:lymphocyte antigen 75 [Elysia marginata]
MIVTTGLHSLTNSMGMCATVSSDTLPSGNYSSDTCFTKNPYLCTIGASSYCDKPDRKQCNDIECWVLLPPPINKCVLRVNRNRNWFEARAHCDNLGGDLWNLHHPDDLKLVHEKLATNQQYWIGATNNGWNFAADSSAVTPGNTGTLRCGHMFREQGDFWKWADTVCDQKKKFICEFRK